MKQILAAGEIQLTKSLGQNFLHDGNQLRRIVEAAELVPGDKVLEIGPGLGPLTEQLLAHECDVLAIEKDLRLVTVLRDRLPRLHLIHDDALEFLQREQRDWRGWKLVANLPYSVASPILVELALASMSPLRMVVTLQLEVARRLMAEAGQPEYGLLTLLVQLGYQPLTWFKIPAGCFFPPPDVDSACVCLVRRNPPRLDTDSQATFVKVVKRCFSQRRKMMFKLLREDWPQTKLDAAFADAALVREIRAEAVSLEQFITLVRSLHNPE